MRLGRAARERLAVALAIAAGALAAGSLAISLAGGGRAPFEGAFAVLAAGAGAACLAAWRSGDRADRGHRALRSLGVMMLAVATLALARAVGSEPWQTILDGVAVAMLAALVATARALRRRSR